MPRLPSAASRDSETCLPRHVSPSRPPPPWNVVGRSTAAPPTPPARCRPGATASRRRPPETRRHSSKNAPHLARSALRPQAPRVLRHRPAVHGPRRPATARMARTTTGPAGRARPSLVHPRRDPRRVAPGPLGSTPSPPRRTSPARRTPSTRGTARARPRARPSPPTPPLPSECCHRHRPPRPPARVALRAAARRPSESGPRSTMSPVTTSAVRGGAVQAPSTASPASASRRSTAPSWPWRSVAAQTE